MERESAHKKESELLLLIRDQILLYSETLAMAGAESFRLFQLKLKTEQLLSEAGTPVPEGYSGDCCISAKDLLQ